MKKGEIRDIVESLNRHRLAISGDAQTSPDLLAAENLLKRSVFHLERAVSSPAWSGAIEAQEGEMLDIEIEEDLLAANRAIAEMNRETFRQNGIKTIDVMGAIGSGKTSVIGSMVDALRGKLRCGMIGGDVATSIDADRIRAKGAVAVQVNTGKECHLDANLVRRALEQLELGALDVLFIENVGNLICPAEFDLGGDKRLVVVSVTEGESMVVKHPLMFLDADVVAINKLDMAEAFGTDVGKLEADVRSINPNARVIKTSTRTGAGVDELIRALGIS